MRAREREAERGEREQEQRGRDVPPERTAIDHRREHVEVRERHRVPRRPSLEEEIERGGSRDDQERQQQKWMPEAHRPPAQTAATWTTPGPGRARTATATPLPRMRCVVERPATSAWPGGVGVKNPRA